MLNDQNLIDSTLAAATTGTVYHTVAQPGDNTTTILLAIITGVIAPLVREVVTRLINNRKAKKQKQNEQL